MDKEDIGQIGDADRALVSDGAGQAVSTLRASIPSAGDVFRVRYPFVRDTYHDFESEGYIDRPTWKPGVNFVNYGPEDVASVADAEGWMILTVEGVFKPGRFPTRVFYTRRWIDPEGRPFGKGKLLIATAEKFRRISLCYQHPYGVGEENAVRVGNVAEARAMLNELLASAIEARSGETVHGLGAQHESAVAEGQTPTPSPLSSPSPQEI